MIRLRVLATLIAVAALASGCSLIGGGGSHQVVASFRDVGDLVENGQVQVNDVEVGRIASIELELDGDDMLAVVTMSVDPDIEVPVEDLGAVVRQTSLLGEQFVQLVPASTGPPFVGEEVVTIPVERTDRRVDVETFLADLSGLIGEGGLEDLNRFTHAQALILEERGREFGETIEGLADLTDVLATRRGDIATAIEGLASAGTTLADNRDTLDSFLDSLDEANVLLADRSDDFVRLLQGLRRFGTVNARFLAQHESAINRGFKALRPILAAVAGAQHELRVDISQLRTFFRLFPNSFGGGPGDDGEGDYIQVEAVLCEALADCHTQGEKGDVPGEGS